MKFSIKDFVSRCDQIRIFRRIWSLLLKKSLMANFIFSAVIFFQFMLYEHHAHYPEHRLFFQPYSELTEIILVLKLKL